MIKYKIDPKKLFNWPKINYEPMEIQKVVHFSDARFKVDVRGRRSGKSYGAGREAMPKLLVPGSKGCILAPTYELCDKIMREIDFLAFQRLKIPTWTRSKIKGSLRYAKLKLGPAECHASEIWARSADNPDSILGEGYDWAIVDEAARISKAVIEQYFRPTLVERKGSCLYVSTPNGFNWFYECFIRGQSDEERWKTWQSWQHSSSSSKYLPPEEIEAAKNELSLQFFLQEFEAKFTSFAGQVYGDFNREVHAKYNIAYDARYDLYTLIDFGYRMPAVLWVQLVYTNTGPKLLVIDEVLHRENISTPELKQIIIKRNKQKGYVITKYFCDPAGVGKQSTTGESDIDIFKDGTVGNESIRLYYRTEKVATNIENGVKFLRAMLYNANGKISLFVSKSCQETIKDLEGYRYPQRRSELVGNPKENPLKDGLTEHGCDALRIGAVNLARYFKNIVYIRGLVN